MGVGDGQGGLTCCYSWGCKESDTTERLNWTELMGPDAMRLVFWMLSLKPTFSLSSFTFIKTFFSSLFSVIRVVSSAYLKLLIFLPAVLIPACASSHLAVRMMYSAYKLNKHGDNIQPWRIPFPIWNYSAVLCLVLNHVNMWLVEVLEFIFPRVSLWSGDTAPIQRPSMSGPWWGLGGTCAGTGSSPSTVSQCPHIHSCLCLCDLDLLYCPQLCVSPRPAWANSNW